MGTVRRNNISGHIRKIVPHILTAPDIPFARDDANRFLPWIIGFMVCLTGIILAFSLSLGMALHRWNGDYLNSFTVQIPAVTGEDGADGAGKTIAVLQQYDWVVSAREMSRGAMQDLIEPWLGESEALETLPLPALIEVRVEEGHEVDIAAVQKRLRSVTPKAEIDNYQLWMEKFSRFTHTVQWASFALAVLITVTTLSIVVLTAKTALRLHYQTVEVLYTIGAPDTYIARQFEQNALRLVLKGAAAGAVVALSLFWLSRQVVGVFDSPLMPALDVTTPHIILFLGLPVLTAAAALFSTRYAVLNLLRQKL